MKKKINIDFSPINDFYKSGHHNQWVETKWYDVYLRNSKRYVVGHYVNSFEIASITVCEKYRSMGIFSSLLQYVETTFPKHVIVVESIMEPRLIPFLESRGYKLQTGHPPTMILSVERSKNYADKEKKKWISLK